MHVSMLGRRGGGSGTCGAFEFLVDFWFKPLTLGPVKLVKCHQKSLPGAETICQILTPIISFALSKKPCNYKINEYFIFLFCVHFSILLRDDVLQ